jgi:hypothetical protein
LEGQGPRQWLAIAEWSPELSSAVAVYVNSYFSHSASPEIDFF